MISLLRAWPRRRRTAAAAIFPVAVVALALDGGGLPGLSPWWLWPWLVPTAALATIVLASYVPGEGTGRLIEVGCRRCAAGAVVAVAGAAVAHAAGPASPVLALVATALTAAGATRRLTDARACPAPPAVTPAR